MGVMYRVRRVSDNAIVMGPADAAEVTDVVVDIPATASSQSYVLEAMGGQAVVSGSGAGYSVSKALLICMAIKR